MRRRTIGTASSTIPAPKRRPTTSTSTAQPQNNESIAQPSVLGRSEDLPRGDGGMVLSGRRSGPPKATAHDHSRQAGLAHRGDRSWANKRRRAIPKHAKRKRGRPATETQNRLMAAYC